MRLAAGEMDPQLRAYTAFVEYPQLLPSTYVKQLMTAWNFSSGDLMTDPVNTCTHVFSYMHIT